ncbi:MAG: hypothetical protein APF76_08035 [Desulfitibacter sp. BRH_c19]|nr:MAG: hypothetical protein APF76_08035 [Desulfitibacter sp. BRH_c19]
MKKTTYVKSEKGFSLIELILTLALLGIVLAVGYNFFFFGQRSFAMGEAQSVIQSSARNTAAIITKDLRNATEITLLESNPSIVPDDKRAFYLDGNIIYQKVGTSNLYQTEAFLASDGLSFKLSEINLSDKYKRYVLTFTIIGEKEGKSYEIVSNILLNNAKILGDSLDNTKNFIAIEYKK